MDRSRSSVAERPRILLKESRSRRLPKKWDSLPCLQLAPENRYLFVCQRCRFPNLWFELCPWCLYPCDVAVISAVLRRRVSSPTLLSDAQKLQLQDIERRARGRNTFPNQTTSSLGSRSTRDQFGSVSDAVKEEVAFTSNVRRRHRNAAVYSATDVVATATVDETLQPFLDQIVATRLENLEHERRSVIASSTIPSLSVRTSRLSSTPTRPSRPSTSRTPPRARPRMSSQNIDAASTREPNLVSDVYVPPLSHTPQSHGLRRKRRMAVLRQRSSCSLRRRATTSSIGTYRRDAAASPSSPTSPKIPMTVSSLPSSIGRTRASNRIWFSTPPPGSNGDTIPLGHPQRPLYTAIRKNMTRPESPSPPPSATHTEAKPKTSIDASFQTLVCERGTRSLDIAPSPDLQRFGSLTRSTYHVAPRPALFSASGMAVAGCSVSGETELRMDLARSRSMDGVPSDFAFREVKPDVSMKTRVKNLGKTLKGLLRVKIS